MERWEIEKIYESKLNRTIAICILLGIMTIAILCTLYNLKSLKMYTENGYTFETLQGHATAVWTLPKKECDKCKGKRSGNSK